MEEQNKFRSDITLPHGPRFKVGQGKKFSIPAKQNSAPPLVKPTSTMSSQQREPPPPSPFQNHKRILGLYLVISVTLMLTQMII